MVSWPSLAPTPPACPARDADMAFSICHGPTAQRRAQPPHEHSDFPSQTPRPGLGNNNTILPLDRTQAFSKLSLPWSPEVARTVVFNRQTWKRAPAPPSACLQRASACTTPSLTPETLCHTRSIMVIERRRHEPVPGTQ